MPMMAVMMVVALLVAVAVVVGLLVRSPVPVVSVLVVVSGRPARVPLQEENETEDGDREPGDRAQPRVEPLRHDVPRGIERQAAQEVDARRVGGGDDESQDHGMPGGAARAHEIGGDDRLAVAGLERMEGAEAHGHHQRQGDDARAQLAHGDELGEGVPRRAPAVRR